jgi:iron complex outermembrane receptor protein
MRSPPIDKTRHEGLEISLSWKAFTWLDLTGNLTYQRATFTEGPNKDREVPMVPNLMANVGLEIRLPLAMVLRPEMRYVGEAYLANDYDNNVEKLQSYRIYNLFLLLQPGRGPLSAFLGVENLTDEKYALWGIDRAPWMPAAYSPAAGRTFKGGISLTF